MKVRDKGQRHVELHIDRLVISGTGIVDREAVLAELQSYLEAEFARIDPASLGGSRNLAEIAGRTMSVPTQPAGMPQSEYARVTAAAIGRQITRSLTDGGPK